MSMINGSFPNLSGVEMSLDDVHYFDCVVLERQIKLVVVLLLAGFKLFVLLFSLFLNTTIIATVSSNKRLHTIPYIFIASLASSELIIAIISGIAELAVVNRCLQIQTAEAFKYVLTFFSMFSVMSNLCNHLIISVERWLYIARPFLHQRIATRRATVGSLVYVWVLPFLINLNLLVEQCGLYCSQTKANVSIFNPVFHFFLSGIMFSIYLHIAIIARRQVRMINRTRPAGVSIEHQSDNTTWTSAKTAWKNVRLLVTIFGTFFLLRTPVVCALIYMNVTHEYIYDTMDGKIIDLVMCCHLCANGLIFIVQDNVFRCIYKQALVKVCFALSRKRVHPERRKV